jgi:hypothetical protein
MAEAKRKRSRARERADDARNSVSLTVPMRNKFCLS